MSDILNVPYIRQRVKTGDSTKFWENFIHGPGMGELYNKAEIDFNYYDANDWTVTNSQAVTEATIAASGGIINIATVGDTENNVTALQYGEAAGTETFVPTAGKSIWFGAEMWCDEATQVDLLVGLCDTDTGIPAARPSDGLFFWKGDGGTGLDFYSASSSTESSETGLVTFAASTFYKVQFRVSGTSQVDYWVDDVHKGSISTNIPTTEMRISFGLADGDGTGGADNMRIRQLYCYQER